MRCDRILGTLSVVGLLCCLAAARAGAEDPLLPEPPSRCDLSEQPGATCPAVAKSRADYGPVDDADSYEAAYQDYASRYGLYDYESSQPEAEPAPSGSAQSWNHDGWYGYTNMLEEGEPGEPVKTYDRWGVARAELAEPSEWRDWPAGDAEISPAYAESYRYGQAYPDDESYPCARPDEDDEEYDYWSRQSTSPDAPVDDADAEMYSSTDAGAASRQYGDSLAGDDSSYDDYDGCDGDDGYDGYWHEGFGADEPVAAAGSSSDSAGPNDEYASWDDGEQQCGVPGGYEDTFGNYKRAAADRAATGDRDAGAEYDPEEPYGEYGRSADQYEYSPSYHFRHSPAWPEYAADQSLAAPSQGSDLGDYDYGYEYRPANPSLETPKPEASPPSNSATGETPAKGTSADEAASSASHDATIAGEQRQPSGPVSPEGTPEDAQEAASPQWESDEFDAEPSPTNPSFEPSADWSDSAIEPSTSSDGSAAPDAARGSDRPASDGPEASGASSAVPSASSEYPEYDMYEWQPDAYETESDGYESNAPERKGLDSWEFESNTVPSHSLSPDDGHSAVDPANPALHGGEAFGDEPYRDYEEYYYGTSRYESAMEPTHSPRDGADPAYEGDAGDDAYPWKADDEPQAETGVEDSAAADDRWDDSDDQWSAEQSSPKDASWFVADESYDEASGDGEWFTGSGSAAGTEYGDPSSVSVDGEWSPEVPGPSSMLDYSGMDLTSWLPGELLATEDAAMLRRIAWLCEEPIEVRHAAWAGYLGSLGPEAVEVAVRFHDATGRSPLELVDDLNAAAGLLAAYRLVARGETGVDSAAGLLVRSLDRFSPAWVQAVSEMTCDPPTTDSIESAQASGGPARGWVVAIVGWRALGAMFEPFREVWDRLDAQGWIADAWARQAERAAFDYDRAYSERYSF